MSKKTFFIAVIISIGYLAWDGALSLGIQAREIEKQERPDDDGRSRRKAQSVNTDEFSDVPASPSLIIGTSPPAPDGTSEEEEIKTPSPTPVPSDTPAPQTRAPGRQLALGILNLIRGSDNDDPPPQGPRGFNLFGSDPGSSPYPSENSAGKLWYVGIAVLALLGISTFMYGRSKHLG